MSIKKHIDGKRPLLFLIAYAWERKRSLFLLFALYCCAAALFPYASIYAVRGVMREFQGGGDFYGVIKVCIIYLAGAGIIVTVMTLSNSAYAPELKILKMSLLLRMQSKLMSVPYPNLENLQKIDVFELAGDAVYDFQRGIEPIYNRFFLLSGRFASVLIYVGVLSVLNYYIGLILLVNTIIVGYFSYRSMKYGIEKRKERAKYSMRRRNLQYAMQDTSNGKDIRVYNLAGRITDSLNAALSAMLSIDRAIQNRVMRASLIDNVAGFFRDAVIFGFLIFAWVNGTIGAADFIACFIAIAALNAAVNGIVDDVLFIHTEKATVRNYLRFMAEPEDGENCTVRMPDIKNFTLEFKNVSFAYPSPDGKGVADNVLDNLSFTLSKGEKLAVIGVNGAGKTTIIKLLLRLYKPDEGIILLNGTDINEIILEEYLIEFGAVLQNINIYAATIAENVAMCEYNRVDLGRAQESLIKAGLGDKLKELKEGLRTQMTNKLYKRGIELSGGEKQKLVIARALYRRSSVLIMDEPTAALDAHAEYALYKSFAEVAEGKALIIISHRLMSTRFCDKILLLDGKRIKESGTHEELMELHGRYYDMFNAQMKYYAEEERSEIA